MAYRVVVDKPRRIRALASSTKIVVADANLEKPQVIVTRASYTASASSRILNAFADYAKPVTQISYRKLSALDMTLDPFSLNQYFRLDAVSVGDVATALIGKELGEVVGTSDQVQSVQLGKGIDDEVGAIDFAYVLLRIQRSFADDISYIDTQTLRVGLNKAESIGFYDVSIRDLEKGLIDTSALTEAASLSVSNIRSDSTSLSEQLSRTVSFVRDFTETASISESITRLVAKPVQDGAAVTDLFARVVSYDRGFVESFGASDADSRIIGKGLADTAALSEALSRTVSFERSFSDIFVLDDFTDVDAIQKDTTASKTNVIGFSETQTFGTEKNLQDTAVVSELAALATERPALDSFSVGDVFQKVTTYSRSFSDTSSLSESSSSSISKVLSDTALVSEVFQKDVAFNRTFSDAVSFAEHSVAAFEKGLTDTASLTESIQIITTSFASSVLNAGALNSSPLNN
jgi:hypothetical protein